MNVRFRINDEERSIETPGDRTLLEVIREDLGLTGTKYGCGEGACRACTVLVGGEPVPSCQVPMAAIAEKEVQTIESLSRDGELHPVQKAFLEAGAVQCGFCIPGMVLAAVDLLRRNPHPDDGDIIEAMNGNICRCCGYVRILQAVRIASGRKEETR